MKQFFIALLSAGVVFSSQAQHVCGTDEHYLEQVKQNPALRQAELQFRQTAQDAKTAPRPAKGLNKAQPTYVIPVVVHVIHQYGSENITKEQIEDQIRILNEDFKRMNADTNNTRSEFKSVAAGMDIEFRLARKDPNGNCTDGIVRVASPLTENARDNVKSVSYWNSAKYLNIWVVKTIQNSSGDPGSITLGYAQFPWDRSTNPTTDGVVVRADFFGSIGTSDKSNLKKGRTLTHEIGHWLGLFHTFQGGCSAGGWAEDIDDTPPVAQPSFGCNLNTLQCDGFNKAMIENYMDYADGGCMNMFTYEQTLVMESALQNYRSQLYSSANLTAAGTADPYAATADCAPIADFYTPATVVCNNTNITLFDASYNGTVNSYIWTLNGAANPVSMDKNPVVSYPNPGVYTVKLQTTNNKGFDTLTKVGYITVQSGVATAIAPYLEPFSRASFPYPNWQVENSPGNDWQYVSGVGRDSNGCLRIIHFNNSLAGNSSTFTTESYSIQGLVNAKIYFWVAYSPRSSSSADQLRVSVSTDCGLNWTQRALLTGSNLSNGKTVASSYSPTSATDWVMKTLQLPGTLQNASNLKIRFEAINAATGGNNIYVDDIYLAAYPLGVTEEATEEAQLQLYPNPTDGAFTLSVDLPVAAASSYTITDLAGKTIYEATLGTLNAGNTEVLLNTTELGISSGVYLINFRSGETKTTLRLLVK